MAAGSMSPMLAEDVGAPTVAMSFDARTDIKLEVSNSSWDVTHRLLEDVAMKAMEWFRKPEGQISADGAPRVQTEDITFADDNGHVQQSVMEIMASFQKLLGCLSMENLLIPLVIYVERFIEALGALPDTMVFDLFLASAIVTIKFWSDSTVSNSTFARLFEVPLDIINLNEVRFLSGIRYNLRLTQDDMNHFKKRIQRRSTVPSDIDVKQPQSAIPQRQSDKEQAGDDSNPSSTQSSPCSSSCSSPSSVPFDSSCSSVAEIQCSELMSICVE